MQRVWYLLPLLAFVKPIDDKEERRRVGRGGGDTENCPEGILGCASVSPLEVLSHSSDDVGAKC